MITDISNSLRIFLADTASITLGLFCLGMIVWLFITISQIKRKLFSNEKRFFQIEKDIERGFSEKK